MGRCKVFASLLILGSLVVLTGCEEKTAKEEELEKQVAELKQQVEQNKVVAEEKVEVEKEKPTVINIIDSNTKSVIKSFLPEELGFGSEDEAYNQEIEKLAKDLARGTDQEPGYDQRMILDKIDENGQIIKGSPLIILEENELVERIIASSEKGGDVELPLYVTASNYMQDDPIYLNEVVVASYTTYFNPSVAGRTKNIELSAKAINNVIVGVGDYFSFNTTVGPSDEAHGYQPAEEAVNGKLVMGIGGGICQTSSTLFNAVDQVGVEYVEKHHHSVTVGYVPKGRDATVSYGGLDFRYQNTTGVPFLITTIMDNGALTVEVRTSSAYAGTMKKAV